MEPPQWISLTFLHIVPAAGEAIFEGVSCIFSHWVNIIVRCYCNSLSVKYCSVEWIPGPDLHVEQFRVRGWGECKWLIHPLNFLDVNRVIKQLHISTPWQWSVNGQEAWVSFFASDIHLFVGIVLLRVLKGDISHTFVNDLDRWGRKYRHILIAGIFTGDHDGCIFEEVVTARIYINNEFEITFVFGSVHFSEHFEINGLLCDFLGKFSAWSIVEGQGIWVYNACRRRTDNDCVGDTVGCVWQ